MVWNTKRKLLWYGIQPNIELGRKKYVIRYFAVRKPHRAPTTYVMDKAAFTGYLRTSTATVEQRFYYGDEKQEKSNTWWFRSDVGADFFFYTTNVCNWGKHARVSVTWNINSVQLTSTASGKGQTKPMLVKFRSDSDSYRKLQVKDKIKKNWDYKQNKVFYFSSTTLDSMYTPNTT